MPGSAWVLRIAAGVVVDHARRRQRETHLLAVLSSMRASDDGAMGAVDEGLDSWPGQTPLRMALAALPEEQGRAVWLRYGAGWTIDDVAARIGRSPGATKQLLHRTIKALHAHVVAAAWADASQ